MKTDGVQMNHCSNASTKQQVPTYIALQFHGTFYEKR